MPKLTAILAVAFMLPALSTVVAAASKDSNVPRIDVEKGCSARAKAIGDLGVATANAVEACKRSEQDARAALVAAWKDIPAQYKASCVKPKDYSPSYGEWIACLELHIDVKKLRAKNAGETSSP
jgi:hypothetical protein